MALEPEFTASFNQTINVAASTGVSGAGDPTYGAATPLDVRLEKKRRIVVDASGDEVTSGTTIYTDTAIDMHDRIWFPGDSPSDPTLARLPLAVDKHPDEDGTVHHYEVFV